MTRLMLLLFFLCVSWASSGVFDYRPGSEWGGLCASGERQSPTNIAKEEVVPAPADDGKIKIITLGTLKEYHLFFTGVNLEISFEEDAFTTPHELYIPANDYTIGDSKKVKKGDLLKIRPLQFHFHTVSEHTVDAGYAASELHIVCQVEKGQSDYCDRSGPCYAVLGVMLKYTPSIQGGKRIFDDLVERLPTAQGEEEGYLVKQTLRMDDLLPEGLDYYTYLGSLTTPPCTESVTWIVFKQHVEVSVHFIEQHQKLVAYTKGNSCTFVFFDTCYPPREKTNNRMVQDLNGRPIYSVEYEKPEMMVTT